MLLRIVTVLLRVQVHKHSEKIRLPIYTVFGLQAFILGEQAPSNSMGRRVHGACDHVNSPTNLEHIPNSLHLRYCITLRVSHISDAATKAEHSRLHLLLCKASRKTGGPPQPSTRLPVEHLVGGDVSRRAQAKSKRPQVWPDAHSAPVEPTATVALSQPSTLS